MDFARKRFGEPFLQTLEVFRHHGAKIWQGTTRVNEREHDGLAAKVTQAHWFSVFIREREIRHALTLSQLCRFRGDGGGCGCSSVSIADLFKVGNPGIIVGYGQFEMDFVADVQAMEESSVFNLKR